MMELIKKYFCVNDSSVPDEKRLWIATAAVFVEIATADGEFSQDERGLILTLLQQDHQLSQVEAKEILQEAERASKQKIDLWQFTNTINKNFSKSERIKIVENLWTLVLVDGQLDQHEQYLTSKLADLMHVEHKDYIEAKLKALRGLGQKAPS